MTSLRGCCGEPFGYLQGWPETLGSLPSASSLILRKGPQDEVEEWLWLPIRRLVLQILSKLVGAGGPLSLGRRCWRPVVWENSGAREKAPFYILLREAGCPSSPGLDANILVPCPGEFVLVWGRLQQWGQGWDALPFLVSQDLLMETGHCEWMLTLWL